MKIKELMNKVTSIENSVNEEMSKEDLYDKLIIAYQALKDIIVLQQGNILIKGDNPLEAPLRDAQDNLQKLRSDYAILETQLDICKNENEENNTLIQSYSNTLKEINKIATKYTE